MWRPIPTGVFLAVVILASGPASAATPTAADIAACNKEAKTEVETASASPSPERRPESQPQTMPDARGGVLVVSPPQLNPDAPAPGRRKGEAAAASPSDRTGRTVTPPADPQLEGMDAQGANDPAYIAAYKRCMRQRGF